MNLLTQNQQKSITHGSPEERVTQLLTHIEKQAWTEYLPLQPKDNGLLC